MQKTFPKKIESVNLTKIHSSMFWLLAIGLLLSLCSCTSAGSEPDGTKTQEETETFIESQLNLKLTVPTEWNKISILVVGKDEQTPANNSATENGILLFRLFERRAYETAIHDNVGCVWSLYALSSEAFQKVYGEDAQTSEILGIADYAIGTDEKYIYLLILPTDVQWLENDSVSENQYATLCTESQQVLESFLNDNGITLNLDCPDSAVFSSSKSAHAISN